MKVIGRVIKRFTNYTPKVEVLGISGSPRKGGNTDIMINAVIDSIKKESGCEIDTEIIHLRDMSFSHCIGCERCRVDKICTQFEDDMTELYEKVIDSKCLILGSPTHYYNVTALMKSFIDRLYCLYDFEDTIPRAYSSRLADQDRVLGVVAVCEQVDESEMGFTVEAMEDPMVPLGYDLAGHVKSFGLFHVGKVDGDEVTLNQCKELGKKLYERLK